MELEGFFSVAKNFFLRKHLSFINNYKKKNYDDASISFVLTEMHCRSWYVVEIGIFRGKSRTPWWHFINHSWLRYSQSKVKLFYCFGTNHETNVKKRDPLLSISKRKGRKREKIQSCQFSKTIFFLPNGKNYSLYHRLTRLKIKIRVEYIFLALVLVPLSVTHPIY